MVPVEQIIAQYQKAIADGEHALAAKTLEALEGDEYCNEIDWKKIETFCLNKKFEARLEVITKKFIRKADHISGRPLLTLANLLIKSKRLIEAYSFIDRRGDLFISNVADKWTYLNVLFALEKYQEALDFLTRYRRDIGNEFSFKILECRLLWQLNQKRSAKSLLISLLPLLGNNPGHWLWFSTTASSFGETEIVEQTLNQLLSMVRNGDIKINEDIVHVCQKNKRDIELRELIKSASIENYTTVQELAFMFEKLLFFGFASVAIKFGEKLLIIDPENSIKSRVQLLKDRGAFLMV